MEQPTRVLILCTGNSARSQMAEGLLRHDSGDRFEVFSAGTKPSLVRPEAIEVMQELGIDITGHRSKSVDEFSGQEFDYVITVCDNRLVNSSYGRKILEGMPPFPLVKMQEAAPESDGAAPERKPLMRRKAA